MSFADWVSNGWLVAHKSSKEEIASLLGIVARDLKDSEAKDVSDDWRFARLQRRTASGNGGTRGCRLPRGSGEPPLPFSKLLRKIGEGSQKRTWIAENA